MELQYKKAMAEYGLKSNQLPEDARIGITQIEQVLKSIRMNESRGKTIGDQTYKKLKAMDKWVYFEILEMMDEKDNLEKEIPHTADEVIYELEQQEEDENDDDEVEDFEDEEEDEDDEEIEEDEDDDDAENEKYNQIPSGDKVTGEKIDADFKIAYDKGRTTLTLEELKNVSKTAYNIIFSNYDDSGDNGIITTHYTLLETDDQVFTLDKN